MSEQIKGQLNMFEEVSEVYDPNIDISDNNSNVHEYLQKKIEDSYEILKLSAAMSLEYYHKPLIITYSGGKDSDVLLKLALECLKPSEFEVLNSHTTVDAPETVYYIRDRFEELKELGVKTTIHYPHYKDGRPMSMWSLIVDKEMPPTRFARYCCFELKETSIPNRFVAVGVREAESTGRKGRDSFTFRARKKQDSVYFSTSHIKDVFEDDKERRKHDGVDANEIGVYDCKFIENAKKNADLICNPIYKWTDREIWQFIEARHMPHNPLYDMGFTRVGCIGCPLADKKRIHEFQLYPKYKQNYINAFQRMLDKRKAKGKDDVTGKEGLHKWTDGEAVYRWWMQDENIVGQMDLNEFGSEDDE